MHNSRNYLLALLLLCPVLLSAQNYNISNSTISTCSGNFYDSGGGGGDYGNNETYVMTFCSSVSGECLRLNFTAFGLESGFDFLTVYNGPDTASPVLGVFTGNTIPGVMTSTTGCLTIEFTSDFIFTDIGFAATISCVTCPGSACPSCNGGTPPANDACATAQNLGALPLPAACPNGLGAWANFNTTNICATAESPYTTLTACQPAGNMASPASDVWYRFTITGPTLNIQVTGMQTPNIGLYAGTNCSNLIGRGCAIGGGGTLNTSFGGLAPGTYYLQVSGGNLNDQCAFTLSLQNNYDCQGCVIQSSFTANPTPVNGTYMAGQTVTFCYTITNYNQTSINWLHAVTPTFGPGWDMSTLVTNPPTSCSGQGTWSWYNSLITSTATGLVTGPGFFFESGLGSPTGFADGNPGNNFGDDNPLNLCDWTFCWTITTDPPAQCVQGASLNITVDTYGDGESGSWTSLACMGDPVADFFATLACCEPPQLAITNPLCPGMNTGSVTGTGQGTAPWDYVWKNGSGTTIQTANSINGSNNINNLAPGNYSLTAVDNSGCSAIVNFTITAPPVLVLNIVPSPAGCNGATDGSATANVAGGTGAYQYLWTPSGATAASETGLAAGTYTVTVTDDNGCTVSAQTNVTQPNPLVVNVIPVNAACGQSNGSVTVNVVGGTGALQYSLDGGVTYQGGNNFAGLIAGNYNVAVTDANGCTGTIVAQVNNSAAPAISSAPVIDVTCNGGNNGGITVNANGGTGILQYSIDNGGTFQGGNTFSNLPAGSYDIVVNDANGCLATLNVTINEPPVVTVNLAGTDPVCGTNNGSVTVTGGGGTPVYQYSIDGGPLQASNVFNNLAPGNHNITINDANGCTGVAAIVLNTAPPLVLNFNTGSATCGNDNGSITANANGGTVIYSFNINGGAFQGAGVFNNLFPGNYTVIVQDANGCTASSVIAVPDQPGPVINNSNFTNVSCFAGTDGSVTVTAGGGSAPLQYSINGGAFQANGVFNGLAAGNYSVVVQDINSCTAITNLIVTEPTQVVAVPNSVNSTCSNSNGSLSVNANGGTGAYQYSLNGGPQQAANAFNNLTAGNYTVTVTDANGCTVDVAIAVADEPAPVIASAPATVVSCNGGNDGTVTVNANGGTGAIQYSIDNGTTFQPGNTFNNLTAGNYSVLISDANGCTATFNTQVTEPAAVSGNANSTQASCGNNDGTVAVIANGGVPAYQYSIDNGTTFQATGNFNNLAAGNYDVVVMDANGCTAIIPASVSNTAAPVISSTPIIDLTCFNSNDGSITINTSGGTAPLNFSIDNGNSFQAGNSFSNLPGGNYSIIVEDALGCQATLNVVINEPSQLVINPQTVNTVCGQSNGSITVTANGGTGVYNYSNNGGTTQQAGNVFNNIAAGNYNVVVTDANGCTATANVVVTDAPGPNIQNVAVTNVNCNGANNGQINISANGGTGALQYSIDNGTTFQGTAGFSNLAPGNYAVLVSDANGCTVISNANITQPAALVINTNSTTASCGNSDGSLTINVNGGTGNIQYSIDNGVTYQANGLFSGIPAGSYNIVVQDVNGCTAGGTGVVNNAAAPAITATAYTDITCFGDDDGTITITASGGTGVLQYSINNGTSFQAGNVFTGLPPGNYDIIVEDANGCQAASVIVIAEPVQLTFSTVEAGTTCSQPNGSITVNANGGTGTYSYSNDGGNTQQPGNTFNGIAAGNYNVVVTDANGCSAATNITVQDAPGPVIQTVAVTDVTCNGADDGQLNITANGGTGALQFSIDNGINFQAAAMFSNLAPGNYNVVITDGNGCTTTVIATVTEPQAVAFNVISTPASCGNSDGTLTINANGGTGALQFSIDNGVTFQPLNLFSAIPAGNYSIVVQDANGCTVSGAGVVNNAAAPVITATAFTDITCFGDDNGTITITANGGTGILQYSIDNGATFQASNIFTNLAPGTYNLVAEDINGCQATDAITISEPTQLSAVFNLTNTTCSNNNGSFTVNASGGTGTYQFSNNNGTTYQLTASFSGLTAGNYSVVIQDGNGCTVSYPVVLTDAPGPGIQAISTVDISCNGAGDGTLNINASGGTAPLNYSIDNGANFQSASGFSNLNSGSYNVIVSDANGCTIGSQANIAEPAPINAAFSSTTASCGNADGSITMNASGGSAPLEFSIDNGVSFQSSVNFPSLPAGSYTIIIQDVNGCSTSLPASVNNAAAPSIQSANFTGITCNGDDNGTITINASGGTGALLFSINNGATTQAGNSFTGLTPGIYNIVVTDVNGCSATSQVTLTEPALLTASSSVVTSTCGGANGGITISTLGGTGIIQFSNNGGTSFQSSPTFNNLAQGNYNIVVTDANGCTFGMNSVVPGAPGPVVTVIFANNLSCFGSNDGLITIVANGGTPPLQYSIDNGITFSPSLTFSSLSQGNYSVVVSDANGCTTASVQNLTEPDEVVFTPVVIDATCGNSDGGITLNASGGTGTYTYSIDNGVSFQPSNIFNALPAGTYAAVVRDASDCTTAAPVNINNIAAPSIQNIPVTNVSCNGLNDGTLNINVIGGTPPLMYSIDGGFTWQASGIFNNLQPGSFNIVVSDANACDVTATASITQPAPINLTSAATTATCGNNDGTVSVSANGGNGSLGYSLNGGPSQPNGNFNNLFAGNYNIVVTDASGCTGTVVASVSNTNAPVISSVNGTNILCFGETNGAINITASGGTGTLNYSINNGASFQPVGIYNNLAAGTYNIVVEDSNGCVASGNITITEPGELILNALAVDATCGNQNGEIQTLASGGTGILLYSINNGINTQPAGTFSNLNPGSYTILITDANGCSTTASSAVNNIAGPVIASLPVSNSNCFGSDDGSVSITLTGGTGPFQYSINGGPSQLTGYFGNLAPGSYIVDITDANGCVADSTLTISEPLAVTIASTFNNTTCSENNGGISITGGGGNGIINYSIDGGMSYQASGIFNNLLAGSYNIQVQDANGCTASSTLSISDAPSPVVQSAIPSDVSCNGTGDGTVTVNTIGGTMPLQYSIDNGVTFQSSNNFTNLTPGVLTVLITDANGCSATSTVTISEPGAILTSVNSTPAMCNGSSNGTATVTALGGVSPFSYAWSNGASGQPMAVNLSAGSYAVTVTDANGCTAANSAIVSEPAAIAVQDSLTNISCFGFNDGSILLVTSGGTAPFSYTWSSPLMNGHENNNISAGTYSVTINDANGCTTFQTYNIIEPAAISLSATAIPVSCYGYSNGSATVTASGGTAPFTYLWSNNFTTATSATLITGTYTVTVTDVNGCTGTTAATISSPLQLTASAISTPVTCKGSGDGTAAVSVNGGTSPYTYQWNNGSISASTGNLNGGNFTVSITDFNNCLTTASVTVQEPPAITVTMNGATTLCIGQNTVISATAQGGNGGFVFTWSNGVTGSSQTVNPTATTTYTVSVADSLGCPATGTALVVTVNPALTLTISQPDTICEGEQVQISAIAFGGDGGPYTYVWTGLPQQSGQLNVSPVITTTYWVTVNDGCGTPAANTSVQVVVNPLPVVDFTPIPAEGCAPLNVFFDNATVTSQSGTAYQWFFGDNTGSIAFEPSHLYTEPGFYTVTLKVESAEGCSSLLTVQDAVKVYPVPEAAIGTAPAVASILHPVINFTDQGNGATWWNWEFGDNSSGSAEQNPQHTYQETGNYQIVLYVMNDHGCRDTAYSEIVIEGASTVYIPNAFSPNNDGRNDMFLVFGIGLNDMEMSIFNRWGNRIFVSDDLDKGWNGYDYHSGSECPDGVYVYLVRVKNFKGEYEDYTGRVTLVR